MVHWFDSNYRFYASWVSNVIISTHIYLAIFYIKKKKRTAIFFYPYQVFRLNMLISQKKSIIRISVSYLAFYFNMHASLTTFSSSPQAPLEWWALHGLLNGRLQHTVRKAEFHVSVRESGRDSAMKGDEKCWKVTVMECFKLWFIGSRQGKEEPRRGLTGSWGLGESDGIDAGKWLGCEGLECRKVGRGGWGWTEKGGDYLGL